MKVNKLKIFIFGIALFFTSLFGGISANANAVNDYIMAQNFPKERVQNKRNEWLNNPNWLGVNMNYRNGVPEGVVIHETANPNDKNTPNAIWNEINYMLNHAGSAFVHSFVDAYNVVEIANPNYMSWGAGPVANQRFIQTETVEVNNAKDFAQELWNVANLQADYLAQYNKRPELGNTVWSHHMVSQRLGGTDHTDPDGYWADSAKRFFNSTYTMNDYEWLVEQVYQAKDPLFHEGQEVQISENAIAESNGAELVSRQNWIGTIKSRSNANISRSVYEYYVEFPDGSHRDHVLEQDIKNVSKSKFKENQTVQVTYGAGADTVGTNIVRMRGMIGKVESVRKFNFSRSAYEYTVVFNDGSRNEHISEQDLRDGNNPQVPKYNWDQEVQISSGALNAADGTNLIPNQNWIGKVTLVESVNISVSKFAYTIEFPDGSKKQRVLEQDVKNVAESKFKKNQTVQISVGANEDTVGVNIQKYRGEITKVENVKRRNFSRSAYEYTVVFADGTRNEHISEQDLKDGNNIKNSKYQYGDIVQLSRGALNAADGANIAPYQNWVGIIRSIEPTNVSVSKFAYTVELPDGRKINHILEQDIITGPKSKFAEGQQVQISSGALNAADGANLIPNQNWVGTISSIEPTNVSISKFAYTVTFPDGSKKQRVLEQDIKTVSNSLFNVGWKIQVSYGAGADTVGTNILQKRGSLGTIQSVRQVNFSHSAYEYTVLFDDGTINEHLSEQDLKDGNNPEISKYKPYQEVQISSGALNAADGANLIPNQNWIGEITMVESVNISVSKFAYTIEFPDGSKKYRVLEQDIKDVRDSRFAVGQEARISYGANADTVGGNIQKHRNEVVLIEAVKRLNFSRSAYEYTVVFPDGTRNNHISEQDIM